MENRPTRRKTVQARSVFLWSLFFALWSICDFSSKGRRWNVVWLRATIVTLFLIRVSDGFQAHSPGLAGGWTRRCARQWLQPIPYLSRPTPLRLRPFGTTTALLDSEAPRMDSDIYAASVAMNGSCVKILSERDLFNGFGSSPSSPNLVADVPTPTANGGYSHTTASRAKISKANKGKTPWNKGRQRSEEEKARISAGVRAKNRERLLKKLADLGLTEEEYEEQKRAERRRKDAERRARKTANGGYTPTLETRQKISKVLKEKHARGEIQRRKVDPSKVRRGFVHSEETRRKISESLKKRWANDDSYRQSMQNKTSAINSRHDVRTRISETLKKKWQDPQFREKMMATISKRNTKKSLGQTHREKISEAMKLRWQDSEYRQKVIDSLAKRSEEQDSKSWGVQEQTKNGKPNPRKHPAVKKEVGLSQRHEKGSDPSSTLSSSASATDDCPPALRVVEPLMTPRKPKKLQSTTHASEIAPVRPKKTSRHNKRAPKKKPTVPKKDDSASVTSPVTEKEKSLAMAAVDESANGKNKGCVSRLREERRDLYDLLYGDESAPINSKLASVFEMEDENLENWDPYNVYGH